MAEEFHEYPAMLYKHPEDKTKEHTYIVVNTPEEKDSRLAEGYRIDPYVPVQAADDAEDEPQTDEQAMLYKRSHHPDQGIEDEPQPEPQPDATGEQVIEESQSTDEQEEAN